MDQTPKTFNISTAARDFGDGDRVIEIDWKDRVSGFADRRMRIKVNGWTLSCVWGTGTYCSGARAEGLIDLPADYLESADAEVAAWPEGKGMIDLGNDCVAGWVPPGAVMKALAAAERDDKRGIRKALTEHD